MRAVTAPVPVKASRAWTAETVSAAESVTVTVRGVAEVAWPVASQ